MSSLDSEVDDDYVEEGEQDMPMEEASPAQASKSLEMQEAARLNAMIAYAQSNGIDAGVLMVAVGNASPDWQAPGNILGVMERYNSVAPPNKQWQLPLKAPTVRGLRSCSCYCLHCKRTVNVARARMNGRQCAGVCPSCGRRVSGFAALKSKQNAKSRAKPKPKAKKPNAIKPKAKIQAKPKAK